MQYLSDWIEHNGDNIHYRCWLSKHPKAWLLISHGLAEHSERYERLGQYLNEQNINVICWDHLGHGEHAQELSMLTEPFDALANRTLPILELCEQFAPKLKLFLLGHSMGSFVALDFCMRHTTDLSGLILSGSGLNSKALVTSATLINRLLCKIYGQSDHSEFFDWLSFSAFNKPFKPNRSAFDWICSKPEEVDLYLQDPFCGFIPSNGMWHALLSYLNTLESKIKHHKFTYPILLQQGEHCCIANLKGGHARLTKALNFQYNHVESLTYPNARHEIYNDHCSEQAMNDLYNWIGKQL